MSTTPTKPTPSQVNQAIRTVHGYARTLREPTAEPATTAEQVQLEREVLEARDVLRRAGVRLAGNGGAWC